MIDTKKCPYCGEEIKAVAKKCRFCGQWLDEETVDTAPVQEEVKPQKETPVEQTPPKEEVKETNSPTIGKPVSNTNSTVTNGSKKNSGYWVVGVIAAALLVGIGFMLGNKDSNQSGTQEQSAISTIEEGDPKAQITQRIEAMYSDVFSSPDANCESKYLTSDFYNLYVQARDMSNVDPMDWKKLIWLNGQEWRKMTVTVTKIKLLARDASINVDLTDNNGTSIKDIYMFIDDARGDFKIRNISYNHGSVKQAIETFVRKNKQTETSDPNDASNDKYESDLVRLFAEEVGHSPLESGVLSNAEYINRFSKLIGKSNYSRLQSNRVAYSLTVRYDNKGKYGFQILDKDDQITYYVIYDSEKDNMTVLVRNNNLDGDSGHYNQEKADRNLIDNFTDSPFY